MTIVTKHNTFFDFFFNSFYAVIVA